MQIVLQGAVLGRMHEKELELVKIGRQLDALEVVAVDTAGAKDDVDGPGGIAVGLDVMMAYCLSGESSSMP